MKKFISMVLVCVALLSCLSAFAAGKNTVKLTNVSAPTKIDMNQEFPNGAEITDGIESTDDVEVLYYGYIWMTDDINAADKTYITNPDDINIITYKGKQYYTCEGVLPQAGMNYYYMILMELRDNSAAVEELYINGQKVDFDCDQHLGTYCTFYDIGKFDENGDVVSQKEDNPSTGDGTPVVALGMLMLFGAVGMGIASKRKCA